MWLPVPVFNKVFPSKCHDTPGIRDLFLCHFHLVEFWNGEARYSTDKNLFIFCTVLLNKNRGTWITIYTGTDNGLYISSYNTHFCGDFKSRLLYPKIRNRTVLFIIYLILFLFLLTAGGRSTSHPYWWAEGSGRRTSWIPCSWGNPTSKYRSGGCTFLLFHFSLSS